MTIAATYVTSEGVVLGADSTTTVALPSPEGGTRVVQIFKHAQKVFAIGPQDSARMGLCTWGAWAIGLTSHRTLVARLADAIEDTTTVEQAANRLRDLVAGALKGHEGEVPDVGYFLGGWDPVTHSPDCFRVWMPVASETKIQRIEVGHGVFVGAPEFFQRAFHGHDPRLRELVLEALLARSRPEWREELSASFEMAWQRAVEVLPRGGYQDVPLREAIDFVYTYLHLTIKAFKFRFGPPICGGPIEIGFISTDRPFRWARHKRFDSAILEEETESP